MLARFFITLPFNFCASKTAQFKIYEYEDMGYKVRVYPPHCTDEKAATAPDEIKVNDESAILANILRIDFQKESFNRDQGGPMEPPQSVIASATASFLRRVRHVCRAFFVSTPSFPNGVWQLKYLNDDETELIPTKGLVTARGAYHALSVSFVGITPEVWDTFHELDEKYEPPPWDVLLLDAYAELPKVGTSVVLAATALETFIAVILDQLASEHSLPNDLWMWINKREDYRQEPTVQEQYDVLLKFFTTHSLKEDTSLWKAFHELKQARNRCVHEGVATIGKLKVPVDAARAREFVVAAEHIIDKIREWLPESMRWPVFRPEVKVEFSKIFLIRGDEKSGPTKPEGVVPEPPDEGKR